MLEAICSRCKYGFQVLYGTLPSRNSRQVTAQRKTKNHPGTYTRQYELRFQLPSSRVEVLQFSVPGREDWIHVRRGDAVSVVHSMRGRRREELLAIHDHTTGTRYDVGKPGRKAATNAGCLATVIALVVGFVLFQTGLGFGAVLMRCALALAGAWLPLAKLVAPTHQLAPDEQHNLATSQDLLATKRELASLRAQVHAEMQDRIALRTRLVALRGKMRSVGLDSYQGRIELIGRAVATLDEQVAVDGELQEAYDKSIAIIEIEHESVRDGQRHNR